MASQPDKNLVLSSRNATAILCSLATVVVLLRLLSRKVSDVKFGWDDAFVIIALLFAWATAAAVFWRVSEFLNGPPDFQTLRTEKHAILLLQNTYYSGTAFVKFSILVFYRRIFPVNVLRITTFALIGFITIWLIAVSLTTILSCTLIDYNWDVTQPDGYCFDARSFSVAFAIPIIGTDLLILLLPLPVVWRLQLQPKRKIALSMIFSLGTFVTISSGIRLYTLVVESPVTAILWTEIELNIAIVCACLPTMMPLFKLVRQKLTSKATLLRTYSKGFRVSKSQVSHSKGSESALANNRDGFIHLADGIELSTATSRAWKGSLPDVEAPRLAEEGPAMGKVHVRNEVEVSRDQV